MTETPNNDSAPDTGSTAAAPGARPVPPLVQGDMRIARDGTWYHEGTPFKRLPLVKLFSTVLRRTEDGGYMLATPVERVAVKVEDAPFVAVEMVEEGEGETRCLRFRTNIDEWVTLDEEHPLRVELDPATGEPSPYILLREGIEALVTRAVFYDLVERAEEREDGKGETMLGVRSAGGFFPLGTAPAE
ncbi:hypothetical protein ABIE65_000156 [Constrictibacter sp. MBR-5]|jgi:hypothetical protein|uniref:DUF1285 domain-containing protein n=1 Tax=Constrictibacter sp. MBR-5 TaxID=3156467 RepID=UPI003393180D